MHSDARTLEQGALIEGDLCIVGAGAAGISMALEWVGRSQRVVLLEGGGFDIEAPLQDLHRGENIGRPYFPLESARLHFFGGTTGYWAGFCSTLDPIDLEERPWVPHSGWPITLDDLAPYYPRAHRLLEVGPHPYDAAYWERRDPSMVRLPFDEDSIWTKLWQFSPPTRFGAAYRDAIAGAENVHLYTHANVCEIEANEAVTAIAGLRVKTLEGKELRVRARHVVLACGAIQNARLLLASSRQAPAGLGNDHDQVGRYFMEHLEVTAGRLVLAESMKMKMKMYAMDIGNMEAVGELALGEQTQRRHGVLNASASLRRDTLAQGVRGNIERFSGDPVERFRRSQARWRATREAGPRPELSARRSFRLFTRQEQAPNPDSRVTLGEGTDALGVPRVRLDWQLTELDKRSVRLYYDVLAREVGRVGIGRVELMDWLSTDARSWPEFLGGGWHHMGTTRMHDDPRAGVLDADCKVHGLANLYVAGSAAFTTAGAINPMLTLIALSLRLSDHLEDLVLSS